MKLREEEISDLVYLGRRFEEIDSIVDELEEIYSQIFENKMK
jgi:uncharacterized protein YqgQ